MKKESLEYYGIEKSIASKAAARGWEAIHAARFLLKDSTANSGGPWLKPTLPNGWRPLVERGSAGRSLPPLSVSAAGDHTGRLWEHLKGFTFQNQKANGTLPGNPRGARAVALKSRSGSRAYPGHTTRKKQLAQGLYSKGSAMHRRLHRGLASPAFMKVPGGKSKHS